MTTTLQKYDYLDDAFGYLKCYAKWIAKRPLDLNQDIVVILSDHVTEKVLDKLGRPHFNMNELEDKREGAQLICDALLYLVDWYTGDWHLTSAGEPTLVDALGGPED